MTGILVVGTITLAASFLCSLLEAALYSITPSQVEVLRQRGTSTAKRLVAMRADVEAPIAAILTVNTISHTVGSAWCGAMVAEEFGSAALGIFAAVFTVLVLALTEIVPKSLGVRYANSLGTIIVWPLQVMIWSVWPIVWVAQKSMHFLVGREADSGPSEEEVVLFAHMAARGGSVRVEERDWVKNALLLDRVTASDLRTPRTVVKMQSAATTVGELVPDVGQWPHSRVPVTDGKDVDKVIGIVHRREVLGAALAGKRDVTLQQLMHPVEFVPMTMPAHELLKKFLDERRHMVAVLDEYGGFQGVVTLEDVIECLLGREIVDEHDEIEDMQRHALEQSPFAGQEEGEGEPGEAVGEGDAEEQAGEPGR